MSFPSYSSYKSSGIDWLGDIPAHWRLAALKRGFKVVLGKMLQPEAATADDQLVPYLRAANIQWSGVDTSDIKRMYFSKRDRAQFRVAAGDLLVSEGGDVGRSCVWTNDHDECYFQNSVNRVRAQEGHSSRYLYYWMSTIKEKGYIDVLCNKSTIAHFTAEKVAALPVPFPSPTEQSGIATFLDSETSKIDGLMVQQQRLMELLKEKRQAIISRVVVRGLHLDARIRASGVDWLGDIPAHWEVRTIARASTKITNGYVGPTRDILEEAGLPYIQATHIKGGRINFDDGYFVTTAWSQAHAKSILVEEDVLIVQTGAGTGDIGLVSRNEAGFNCHALIIVAPDKSLLRGAFLSATLQSTYGQERLASIQTGAMHPHLNCGEVKFVEIPVPPLPEQDEILEHIRVMTNQFDSLAAEAQRAIDLLKERRVALIAAAVTGQIDVRRFAEGQAA